MTEEEKAKAKAMGLEPEVVFNTLSDRRILSVKLEDTDENIFEIAGYDLQIKFNRNKLRDVPSIEALLDGIKDLFRKLIMQDLLEEEKEKGKGK